MGCHGRALPGQLGARNGARSEAGRGPAHGQPSHGLIRFYCGPFVNLLEDKHKADTAQSQGATLEEARINFALVLEANRAFAEEDLPVVR